MLPAVLPTCSWIVEPGGGAAGPPKMLFLSCKEALASLCEPGRMHVLVQRRREGR